MSRIACLLVLLTATSAPAADLPPGAVARLGDDRYRVGGEIEHFALSPDGKQFATTFHSTVGVLTLTVWNAATGQPIREQKVNRELFKGFVWGSGGAFAIVLWAEPGVNGKPGKALADNFRVWDFTDPKAAPPPLLPQRIVGLSPGKWVDAEWSRSGPEYDDFVFSADGQRVAARHFGMVSIFELKPTDSATKLKRVGVINLGDEGVDDIRISANGKTLVTFRKLVNPKAEEATATLWDVASGKPAKPIRVPFTRHTTPMVTPDARSLVVQDDEEHGLDLIDFATAKRRTLVRWESEVPSDPNEYSTSLGDHAFSASGQVLVVGVGHKSMVIDFSKEKVVGRIGGHANDAWLFAVSDDGARVATTDRWGLVRLWDAKTLRPLHDAPGHRSPVRYAQLSSDGKRVLTWGWDRTVRLWDLATGKELRAFSGGTKDFDDQPTFTPDGTAILYSTPKQLVSRDLQTGLEVPLPGDIKGLSPRFAVFSPDGKSVLTWAARDVCVVHDWPGGKTRFEIREGPSYDSPGFSSDSSVVFTNALQPDRWDAKTGKKLPPAWKDNCERVSLESLRPNPRWLVYEAEDSPRVIEAGTGKRLPQFEFSYGDSGHPKLGGWGVALSPTGGQFVHLTGFERSAVGVFELATGHIRRELHGHRGDVRVLGFTPDGTRLLTAGDDHTVLVWDMRLQNVPLPEVIKKETDAVKLWNTLATGKAQDAYLAMARLGRDPDAAIKMAKLKLKPATKTARDTDATKLADSRAIELLEALDTDDSRKLLKELADGHADRFRTQEANRALQRREQVGYNAKEK